jgi:hypothetical protein
MSVPSLWFQGDMMPELAGYFKTGNSKELGLRFSSSIELNILDEEEVYSKVQAEQIIRDFFTKHPPVGSGVLHLIDTNPNYRFGILSLATKNGKYRVSVTLKKTNASFFITELRIEPDKS